MTAKTLMVQGSSSSAGKSLLVAALCRHYARLGVCVAPFKAQNMSNNAAVCPDGSEIGRAQAVQAAAAGLKPHVDMNPILIKPESNARSQVIVNGRPWQTLEARTYYQHHDDLWKQITTSLEHLQEKYELVIIEGAGSPVELNLKQGDMVNMAVASHVQAPVLLVGDIDRGGIFAQLLGTLWLLPSEERRLVRGLVVNKFRGDITLFDEGIRLLEKLGDVPVLGVIPYLHGLSLPEEDAVALDTHSSPEPGRAGDLEVVVIRLPHIANFDDFDALAAEPGVRVRYIHTALEFGKPRAIVIPGTKSTVADLEWLRRQGLAELIIEHAQLGGAVVGICGGYQMLGRSIFDPDHIESPVSYTPGLNLLPVETHFISMKATYQVNAKILSRLAWLATLTGQEVSGYEIHMGHTSTRLAWLKITHRNGQPADIADGAINSDGQVWGCYIHGLFENSLLRRAWLGSLGWTGTEQNVQDPVHTSLDRLADTVAAALNMDLLERIIWDG